MLHLTCIRKIPCLLCAVRAAKIFRVISLFVELLSQFCGYSVCTSSLYSPLHKFIVALNLTHSHEHMHSLPTSTFLKQIARCSMSAAFFSRKFSQDQNKLNECKRIFVYELYGINYVNLNTLRLQESMLVFLAGKNCGNLFVCVANVDLQWEWRQLNTCFIVHRNMSNITNTKLFNSKAKRVLVPCLLSPRIQRHYIVLHIFNLYAFNFEFASNDDANIQTKNELNIKFVLAQGGNPNISSWISVWWCAATVKFAREKCDGKEMAYLRNYFERNERSFSKKLFTISQKKKFASQSVNGNANDNRFSIHILDIA